MKKKRLWGPCQIFEFEGGTVHVQHKYIGYGSSYYMVVGSKSMVLNYYERIKKNYPPQGYCGVYPKPIHLGNNLWIGYPNHSESCE